MEPVCRSSQPMRYAPAKPPRGTEGVDEGHGGGSRLPGQEFRDIGEIRTVRRIHGGAGDGQEQERPPEIVRADQERTVERDGTERQPWPDEVGAVAGPSEARESRKVSRSARSFISGTGGEVGGVLGAALQHNDQRHPAAAR